MTLEAPPLFPGPRTPASSLSRLLEAKRASALPGPRPGRGGGLGAWRRRWPRAEVPAQSKWPHRGGQPSRLENKQPLWRLRLKFLLHEPAMGTKQQNRVETVLQAWGQGRQDPRRPSVPDHPCSHSSRDVTEQRPEPSAGELGACAQAHGLLRQHKHKVPRFCSMELSPRIPDSSAQCPGQFHPSPLTPVLPRGPSSPRSPPHQCHVFHDPREQLPWG